MMVAGVAAGTGCTAKASFQAGAKEAAPPPPPPAPEPAPAPPPAEEKPKRLGGGAKMGFKMQGFQLMLPGPINFETGTAKIAPESEEVLKIVSDFMNSRKDVTLLRIQGHTDDVGDDAKNQTLSEQRALAVSQWLVAKGNDCKRFLPVGFGETKHVADNATPEGKAQNRRTEFHIAAVNGKATDGKPVDGGGKVAGDPCK
ncbi:MAG TPA: OmpA family protein [Candidatus Nanopelagicales bacterium]|nr:OmpA family protein [Candidatus Nanopelagicales bacterium]